MANRRKTRWPKGTWMRLRDLGLLRALVGPEPGKKMSARRLASYVGCNPSFINQLMADPSSSYSRKSCKPATAERIAEVLGVPLEALFVATSPTNGASSTKSGKVRAA